MEEFGSIMKQERIKKGLSITELSKFTGVDIKTISFIERGLRRKPTLDTLFRLANVLECITFDMLKSIGYTENEIVTYLCDDEDEGFEILCFFENYAVVPEKYSDQHHGTENYITAYSQTGFTFEFINDERRIKEIIDNEPENLFLLRVIAKDVTKG
jgi:transcriptional regulator with XRE-family HTH domain